tara:strand:- start:66 stop:929 length:864 start_codon:yes stop_codon:yes gene_type:complete
MYFPKSQLETDLYTNGGEFLYGTDNLVYTGPYFIAQGNQFYSGRNPNDKPIFVLTKLSTDPFIQDDDPETEVLPNTYYIIDDEYYIATNTSIIDGETPPSTPLQDYQFPTEEDYKVGEFERYFLKRINDIKYVELSNIEYRKYLTEDPNVSWQLYTPFQLPWEITGNRNKVFNVNKNTVNRIQTDLQLLGFKSYFKGKYDRYFKYTPQENLYTGGNEYKLASNGRLYKGYYHIHSEKGPMVGNQHTKLKHEYLIPINNSGSNYQNETSIMESERENYTDASRIFGGY